MSICHGPVPNPPPTYLSVLGTLSGQLWPSAHLYVPLTSFPYLTLVTQLSPPPITSSPLSKHPHCPHCFSSRCRIRIHWFVILIRPPTLIFTLSVSLSALLALDNPIRYWCVWSGQFLHYFGLNINHFQPWQSCEAASPSPPILPIATNSCCNNRESHKPALPVCLPPSYLPAYLLIIRFLYQLVTEQVVGS